ncbi:substrate-binding domain-containing protein [Actinoplanes sp. M2I2]|uniref:sugar ABC transporter substrate-binding protein n=1 Tax=Actinoplanes sp. M2I2 TaxID=1734444 RepID=UPI00202176EE|nr:substrate-binding domain-containing protein [Actinoplanes sp. M2I2]
MININAARPGRVRLPAALAVSAVLLGGVAGCVSDEATPGAAGASGDASAMTIQFVNPLPSYPTWRLIGDCMKEEAEKNGADFTMSGPTGQGLNAGAMIQQVQQATATKKDAVITFPAGEGFNQVLKQAQASGVVTGTFYGPGGADSGADINAAPDFGVIGSQLVEAVSALPGEHVIGLVAAAGTGLGKSWLDGVKAAVAKTGNVSIAGEVYTGDDAAKALPQVTGLLTAHPDITQILTHMGTTTPGAVSAIKARGLQGKAFLLAVGHDNGGTEALKSGSGNLMLMQNVCLLGKDMVDRVVAKQEGRATPPIPVGIEVVGQDRMQKYLDEGWV